MFHQFFRKEDMQYRGLLFFITCCALSATAQAQKKHDESFGSYHRSYEKVDTIRVSKPAAMPAGPILAMKVAAANKEREQRSNILVYKPVPLAGQKAYFGEMNDYVNNFVRQYLLVHNQTLNVVQTRSNTPFPLIDNILEKQHIPKQLKYLAVIESALNHNAVSHAGAVGPWQLMESTAKMMGLTVNRRNDERKDWYKSTTAAAKYLSLLYSQLNDWLLVIAAYNSGPTPVQRAIEITGSHNFWDIKKYLPHETQGHVLAFIATASIFENLSKFISLGSIPLDFNFGGEEIKADRLNTTSANKLIFTEEETKAMTIVRLSQPLSMDLLCDDLKLDAKQMHKWNPDYDLYMFNTYPTDYYNLRLPKDKLDLFVKRKEFLSKKSKQIFNEIVKA